MNNKHNWGWLREASNYEKYAENKQPELLNKTASLQLAISMIKEAKSKCVFGIDYIDGWIDCISLLFGLQYEEIKNAVNDEKYWCL